MSRLKVFCFAFIAANPAGILGLALAVEVDENALAAVTDPTLVNDKLDRVAREALWRFAANIVFLK